MHYRTNGDFIFCQGTLIELQINAYWELEMHLRRQENGAVYNSPNSLFLINCPHIIQKAMALWVVVFFFEWLVRGRD